MKYCVSEAGSASVTQYFIKNQMMGKVQEKKIPSHSMLNFHFG
jgi:hypothetical protein